MIQGTTLQETITEIMDAAKAKRDYLLPSPLIRMNAVQDLEWVSATGPVTATMRDETQQATDKALWMQVQDHMDSISTPDGFQRVLASLRETADDKVAGDPQRVVEELSNKWALREDESSSVLYSLIREGDMTRFGLSQAVTQVANTHASYDRAIELEVMGGKVMALEGAEWNGIAMAGVR